MPAATTNKEKQVSTKLEFIPIAKVVADGGNPRTTVDDVALEELTLSILEHGVLQPVLVTPNGGGKFHLVAGSRRLAAAKAAKLEEIPAQVMAVDSSLTAALTENLQRLDLTPLEEAEALHQLQQETKESARAIAKRIGKSNDYVSDRLRLVTLPDGVRAALRDGHIGLHAIPAIARIAEASPEAAEVIAGLLAEGDADSRDLEDAKELGRMVADVAGADTGLWPLESTPVKDLPTEDAKKLAKRWKDAREVTHPYNYDQGRISFDQDDVDAARAFGCLLTIENASWRGDAHFVNDGEWLVDRVVLKIEHEEREAAKKPKKKDDEPDAEAEERERQEAEERERVQREAVAINEELGRKTLEAFAKATPTVEQAQLVARLALSGKQWPARVKLVDHRVRDAATLEAVEQFVQDEISKAKTVDEVLGIVLRVFVMATLADGDAIAGHSWFSTAYAAEIEELAKKVKVVPAQLKKKRQAEAEREGERNALELCSHLTDFEESATEEANKATVATLDELYGYGYGLPIEERFRIAIAKGWVEKSGRGANAEHKLTDAGKARVEQAFEEGEI